jgi:hypothetical protein
MLPLSAMVDRSRHRAAALLGVVAVALEFALALGVIWEVDQVLPGGLDQDQLLMTGGTLAAAAIASMVCLTGLAERATRIAGITGLSVAAGFFLTATAATWVGPGVLAYGRLHELRMDLWATAWTIAGFGVTAAAALVGVGSGDRRHWRWGGIAASVAAAAILVVHVWWDLGGDERVFSLFAVAGISIAWANLIVRVPLLGPQCWVRLGTLLAGALTGLFTELMVFDLRSDGVERLDAAAAILAGCGTLALAVLARMNRRVDFEWPCWRA